MDENIDVPALESIEQYGEPVHATDALIATVRGGFPPGYSGKALAALDSLAAELERRWVDPSTARKLEAYDAARAKVKREALSRAELVLRAEAAEAELEAERFARKGTLTELERVKTQYGVEHEAYQHLEADFKRVKAERDSAYDEAQADIWNEPVCSACGRNHDRDESSMCETGEVITWREWTDSAQARLDQALAALREIADPENDTSEARRVARAAIAEIEGETPDG